MGGHTTILWRSLQLFSPHWSSIFSAPRKEYLHNGIAAWAKIWPLISPATTCIAFAWRSHPKRIWYTASTAYPRSLLNSTYRLKLEDSGSQHGTHPPSPASLQDSQSSMWTQALTKYILFTRVMERFIATTLLWVLLSQSGSRNSYARRLLMIATRYAAGFNEIRSKVCIRHFTRDNVCTEGG